MQLSQENAPVGVFDSGLGGLSVLKRLTAELPGEDFLYFGDSANAPYGTKTREQVCTLARAAAARLCAGGAKALVVACNTATAAAIGVLREENPDLPVIGMEPALKPAALCRPHPRVIVMATPMTLHEEKFAALYGHYAPLGNITVLSCPGLAEFVERGEVDSPALRRTLAALLTEPLSAGCDAIVLGCTHYPFLRGAIRALAGEEVLIFDGCEGTARETRRRLSESGLLSRREGGGRVTLESSLDTPALRTAYETLLRPGVTV